MLEPHPKYLSLHEFLESVKRELLAYQQTHSGEPALFDIQSVTIEASLVTSYDAEGKATIYVAGIGAKASEQSQHKVSINMAIAKDGNSVLPFRGFGSLGQPKENPFRLGENVDEPPIKII